ncbi:hypothetical protein NKH77_10955 [Streptomyces sp. M19]
MESAEFFRNHLERHPVLGIFRNLGPAETVEMCERAWEFGVELVEVPVQSPDALPALRAALDAAKSLGKGIGAGTVTTLDQLTAVRDLGVAFTVAPGCTRRRRRVPADGPAAPARRRHRHRDRGGHGHRPHLAQGVPRRPVGPRLDHRPAGALPHRALRRHRRVDADNAKSFLDAGCRGVAVGSALSDPTALPGSARPSRRPAADLPPTYRPCAAGTPESLDVPSGFPHR